MPLVHRKQLRQFREYEHEQVIPDSRDNGDYQSPPLAVPYYQQQHSPQRAILPPGDEATITIPPPPPADQDFSKPLSLQFSNHLDRIDRNWRNDPFWKELYPRWAEPIFKEGIDVKANIVNDRSRFAVDIDAYQFKPEELQVSL